MNEKKFNKLRNDMWLAMETELQKYFKAHGKTIPAHMAWKLTDTSLKISGLMCKYEDCDRIARARGYCTKHYQSQCRKVITIDRK